MFASITHAADTDVVTEPGYNPAAEAFKNFDQDQSGNLLGSLHLDTEDEPRRGASRANSVRFDESALHGHFAHGSRSSSDFFPLRTGSGLGSHPMTERSSSHKSEGRQSSTGQSAHSTRLNSLGIEARQPVLPSATTPLGPPPGLFILGPLPSIIRCWLDTNFSNETLLYAAICTGSCRSLIGNSLVQRLGLTDQIADLNEKRTLRIQVYLPEATIQQSSSRSGSPAPHLPTLAVDFWVQDMPEQDESIQIILGSDVLRAKNADILFSQALLTIYDDDRNKLAIPLVRPENAAVFQGLITTNGLRVANDTDSDAKNLDTRDSSTELQMNHSDHPATHKQPHNLQADPKHHDPSNSIYSPVATSAKQPSVIGEGRLVSGNHENGEAGLVAQLEGNTKDSDSSVNGTTPDTPTKGESSGMWGPWRRDSTQNSRPDSSFSSVASSSGYQRAGRGRGMKVLKPSRSGGPSRSLSAAQTPTGLDPAPSRFAENGNRNPAPSAGNDHIDQQSAIARSSFSSDSRSPLQPLTNKTRSSNPVGGASAFGWLNSSQQKQPSATTE